MSSPRPLLPPSRSNSLRTAPSAPPPREYTTSPAPTYHSTYSPPSSPPPPLPTPLHSRRRPLPTPQPPSPATPIGSNTFPPSPPPRRSHSLYKPPLVTGASQGASFPPSAPPPPPREEPRRTVDAGPRPRALDVSALAEFGLGMDEEDLESVPGYPASSVAVGGSRRGEGEEVREGPGGSGKGGFGGEKEKEKEKGKFAEGRRRELTGVEDWRRAQEEESEREKEKERERERERETSRGSENSWDAHDTGSVGSRGSQGSRSRPPMSDAETAARHFRLAQKHLEAAQRLAIGAATPQSGDRRFDDRPSFPDYDGDDSAYEEIFSSLGEDEYPSLSPATGASPSSGPRAKGSSPDLRPRDAARPRESQPDPYDSSERAHSFTTGHRPPTNYSSSKSLPLQYERHGANPPPVSRPRQNSSLSGYSLETVAEANARAGGNVGGVRSAVYAGGVSPSPPARSRSFTDELARPPSPSAPPEDPPPTAFPPPVPPPEPPSSREPASNPTAPTSHGGEDFHGFRPRGPQYPPSAYPASPHRAGEDGHAPSHPGQPRAAVHLLPIHSEPLHFDHSFYPNSTPRAPPPRFKGASSSSSLPQSMTSTGLTPRAPPVPSGSPGHLEVLEEPGGRTLSQSQSVSSFASFATTASSAPSSTTSLGRRPSLGSGTLRRMMGRGPGKGEKVPKVPKVTFLEPKRETDGRPGSVASGDSSGSVKSSQSAQEKRGAAIEAISKSFNMLM